MLSDSPGMASDPARAEARKRLSRPCNLSVHPGRTVMLAVFDFCCEHRYFTTEEMEAVLGRKWAVASGGFTRALQSLRRQGYLVYEFNRSAKAYEILAVEGDRIGGDQ